MVLGWNRTQATLVGGERFHHCAIPAPHPCSLLCTHLTVEATFAYYLMVILFVATLYSVVHLDCSFW